jgi:hypothetical protein
MLSAHALFALVAKIIIYFLAAYFLFSELTNPMGRFGGSGGVASSRSASNSCFN